MKVPECEPLHILPGLQPAKEAVTLQAYKQGDKEDQRLAKIKGMLGGSTMRRETVICRPQG